MPGIRNVNQLRYDTVMFFAESRIDSLCSILDKERLPCEALGFLVVAVSRQTASELVDSLVPHIRFYFGFTSSSAEGRLQNQRFGSTATSDHPRSHGQ